jgi:hypothetical protein
MLRSEIRTLVRRHIQETVADNFANADLDILINVAYQLVVKQVRRVSPDEFLTTALVNTAIGTSLYNKPAGARRILEVALLDAAGVTYNPLPYMNFVDASALTASEGPVFTIRGQQYGIYPAPTAVVVNGIRVTYQPTVSLAADGDTPLVEDTLQYAIALWAALLAKGESPESDTKEAAQLTQILNDIPDDYGLQQSDRAPRIGIDAATLPGRGWNRTPNDEWPR